MHGVAWIIIMIGACLMMIAWITSLALSPWYGVVIGCTGGLCLTIAEAIDEVCKAIKEKKE